MAKVKDANRIAKPKKRPSKQQKVFPEIKRARLYELQSEYKVRKVLYDHDKVNKQDEEVKLNDVRCYFLTLTMLSSRSSSHLRHHIEIIKEIPSLPIKN